MIVPAAEWASYRLDFKFLARTSRQAMTFKDTYLVRMPARDGGDMPGYGECALFRGLSADDVPDYEQYLDRACATPTELPSMSSIIFGIESAMIDAGYVEQQSTPFLEGREGISINGLIWMGDKQLMRKRIDEKLDAGFKVLKLKIGGIDFENELQLLEYIRSRYSPEVLELRLDANGSFTPENALDRLNRLSDFSIHSLEQPIKAGQHEAMAQICSESPIDIALDEELIGVRSSDEITQLLDTIAPQYIILKPALCGGLSGADIWADEAERRGIGWWATSALESNIGLLAIARWLATRGITRPQGLGTGQLFHNNIPSGVELRGSSLFYNPELKIEIPDIKWQR